MSKRELTLVMTFKNAGGTNTNVSLKGVRANLTEVEINAAMDAILNNNAFYSTGGDLVSKVKADIVDKNTSTFELA